MYQQRSQVPAEHRDSVFVVDEELRSVEESSLDALSERLINLSIDGPFEAPIYGILSRQIWSNVRQYLAPEPRNMPLLLLLYDRLADAVDEVGAERVVCEGVSGIYMDLLRDFESNEGVPVTFRGGDRAAGISEGRLLLRSISAVVIAVIDLVVSLLVAPFLPGRSDEEVALVFPVGRPQVFEPLYGRLEIPFDTLYTARTVSYLAKYRDILPGAGRGSPVAASADLVGLLGAVRLVLSVYWDLFVGHRQRDALVAAVEEATSHELRTVVSRINRRGTLVNLDSLMTYVVCERLFSRKYRAVVVPGMARKTRALVYAAHQHDVEVHHLSHGIGNRRLRFLRIEQTYFTSGEIDQGYIERHNELMRPVVTGLPKHQHILERRQQLEASGDPRGSGTVLVATQRWLDRIRESFIQDILPVLLEETTVDVVIKPHPGETVEYYEGLVAALGLEQRSERVTVEKGDLYEMIYRCEYVVTATSNVALESLIMGVPVVSYNAWAPDIETPLFVEFGAVPAFDGVEEFREFVRQPNLGRLHEVEDAMLEDDYLVYGNSIDAIASRVAETLDLSLGEGS